MSLRTRLALALAAAAAIPVLVFGAISYESTTRQLHRDIDFSLTTYVNRLSDPDGKAITALCAPRNRPDTDDSRGDDLLAGLPGATVQCVSANGTSVRWIAPDGVKAPPAMDETFRTVRHGVGPLETVNLGGQTYRFVTFTGVDGTQVRVGRTLADADRSLDVIGIRLLGAGAFVIVIAALAGLLLARHITGPIETLTTTAEAVAATGVLDRPVPVERNDEIGRLANALATMLAALSESRSQQQQLVQDAGHELKTPLTSVRANIDTLRRHPDLSPTVRDEVLVAATGELGELTTLVDEVIALSIDDADSETASDIRLDEVVMRVVDRARRRWNRDIVATLEKVTVTAPPRLLTRAVGNLVQNAVKFSVDGSPIDISLTATPPTLRVRDRGNGIDPGDLPHVFDRFYRAVAARSMPGSGLGLAIVRRAADESHATVEAANHPGGGAVFTLRWLEEEVID